MCFAIASSIQGLSMKHKHPATQRAEQLLWRLASESLSPEVELFVQVQRQQRPWRSFIQECQDIR